MSLRIGRTIKSVYVKQHNALSFRHRLGSLFYPSAALRSLFGAATLLQEGYATARPIAAVEYCRRGILIKSIYLSEEIVGAKNIVDYWSEELAFMQGIEGRLKRQAVLKKLAVVFKSLHERKIYHNDLKASNILARDEGSATEPVLSLIDLQGIRTCFYVSQRRRIKNLAQINRTLGEYLSRKEKLTFFQAYMGDGMRDRIKRKKLLLSVIKETSRQILREQSRHPSEENEPSLQPRAAVGQGGTKSVAARLGVLILSTP